MKRNRGYYYQQRKKAIQRKLRIQQDRMGTKIADEIYDERRKGQLAKGKVHCSCPSCRTKSYDEPSHRDRIKDLQSRYQLTHYFVED